MSARRIGFRAPLWIAALAGLLAICVASTAPAAGGLRVSQVTDINPDGGQAEPSRLSKVGDTVFFYADDPIHGRALWRSDGTNRGTRLVKDMDPAVSFTALAGPITDFEGDAFYPYDDGKHGYELWKSNGTTTGTRLVKDIFPGEYGSAMPLGITHGRLVLRATSPERGSEIWTSDGTARGTKLIKDINPGEASSFHSSPNMGDAASTVGPDGDLYLIASRPRDGQELWRSDGTSRGTRIVRDIGPGRFGSSPRNLTPVGGKLFFSADDGSHGAELWKSDGTESGTRLVKNIRPGVDDAGYPNGSSIFNVAAAGGSLYFKADDGVHGDEPWTSDGTRAGTKLLQDIDPGLGGHLFGNPVAFGGIAYFTVSGSGLWRSDGTTRGTRLLKSLFYPARLTVANGRLFLSAEETRWTTGSELWTSDGTRAGTKAVIDLEPGEDSSYPGEFIGLHDELLFRATTNDTGSELWKAVSTTRRSYGADRSTPTAGRQQLGR